MYNLIVSRNGMVGLKCIDKHSLIFVNLECIKNDKVILELILVFLKNRFIGYTRFYKSLQNWGKSFEF